MIDHDPSTTQDLSLDPEILARRWTILGVLCLSLLVVMLANTSMNVALPVLSQNLGASATDLQWIVDAYSLVFAGLLFTAGTIGDRYGRKMVLQVGLAVFGLATLIATLLVDTPGQLIATRAVMGLGGALVMPATLSILTNVFPREERAKAVAMWAGISAGGTALGPVLSGFLLEHYSWNSVFAINIPVIAMTLVAVWRLVPSSRNPYEAPVDVRGALLSIVGVSALVFAIIEAPNHGWLAPETLLVAALGLGALGAFTWWELRAEHPMLNVRLFKIPAFGVSSLTLTLVFFTLMGIFFSVSQLLQLVFGYSPLDAAVHMLPVSVVMVIVAPQSPRLVQRFGRRAVVSGGMLAMAVGLAILSQLDVESSYLLLLLGLIVMAGGIAAAMSPTTDLLMSAVPREHAGMGSAMNDTTRELGGSLGVAVFGSLLASRYVHELSPVLTGLPEAGRSAAEDSLGGALRVASEIGGSAGEGIAAAARDAFMSGFSLSLVIGTFVIAATAVLAYKGLPDTAADDETVEHEVEDELEHHSHSIH